MKKLDNLLLKSRELLKSVTRQPIFLIDINFLPPEYSKYKSYPSKNIVEAMQIINEHCILFGVDAPTQETVLGFIEGGNVFTLSLKKGSQRRNEKDTYLVVHYNWDEGWKEMDKRIFINSKT